MHMPVSDSVAAAIAAKAARESRERDQLKRLILQVCNLTVTLLVIVADLWWLQCCSTCSLHAPRRTQTAPGLQYQRCLAHLRTDRGGAQEALLLLDGVHAAA